MRNIAGGVHASFIPRGHAGARAAKHPIPDIRIKTCEHVYDQVKSLTVGHSSRSIIVFVFGMFLSA